LQNARPLSISSAKDPYNTIGSLDVSSDLLLDLGLLEELLGKSAGSAQVAELRIDALAQLTALHALLGTAFLSAQSFAACPDRA
jgi:hypothetical protein